MNPYIDKSLIAAAGFAATMAIVGISWLAYAGGALAYKAPDDDVLTAKQCIDNNTPNGSVEPFEEALVAEGIVNTELDKIRLTRGDMRRDHRAYARWVAHRTCRCRRQLDPRASDHQEKHGGCC
jgi:hypothetical protein